VKCLPAFGGWNACPPLAGEILARLWRVGMTNVFL